MSAGFRMNKWMDRQMDFPCRSCAPLLLLVGPKMELQMCPGPHKQLQPKHRPSQVFLPLAPSGSTACRERPFYTNVWVLGLSSTVGVKSKRSKGS